MTKKQMETAIKDLQKQMLNLASRTGNRDAENESKIGTVDSNVDAVETATNSNTSSISALEDTVIELTEMLCE